MLVLVMLERTNQSFPGRASLNTPDIRFSIQSPCGAEHRIRRPRKAHMIAIKLTNNYKYCLLSLLSPTLTPLIIAFPACSLPERCNTTQITSTTIAILQPLLT